MNIETPTTEETTAENKKNEQFTARIKSEDKAFVTEYVKKYPTIHEGFSALLNVVKNGTSLDLNEYTELYNELNIKFIALQEENNALQQANKDLTLDIEVRNQNDRSNANKYLLEFTKPFIAQLTNLRRLLKQQGKIPAESTELEFMQNFISEAMQKHVNNNYPFLNR